MNNIFAVHTLLWNYPLFKYAEKRDSLLIFNILVCGLSEKADIFIKTAFSCGQMLGSKLNFTLCDENAASYIDNLFKKNPGLKRNAADSYAEFIPAVPETDTAKNYNYIFISTGSQEKNASELKRLTKRESSRKRLIAVDGADSFERTVQKSKDKIVVLNVDEPALFELNEMAFRVHRLWEKAYDERKSVSLMRQQFESQDDYYRMSSLSNVVHIKYKLASVGINTDNLIAAAENFNKNVLSDKNNSEFKKIVALEHKRWCAEKIIDGWRAPAWDEFKGYAFTGLNKDHKYNAMKLHPCIAEYGDPDARFLSEEAHSYWDGFDAVEKIDSARISPLDKASLKIHFLLRTLAEESIKKIRRLTEDVHSIINEVSGGKITALTKDFLDSVERLIDNDINSGPAFTVIKEKTLNGLSEAAFIRLKNVITDICGECGIIIQRNRYIDYKKLDFKIVEAIPYILTPAFSYSSVIKIYSEKIGHNITAATAMEPERLIIAGRAIPAYARKRIDKYFVNRGNNIKTEYIEYGGGDLESYIKEILAAEETGSGAGKIPIDITGAHPSEAAAAGRLRQPLFQYGANGLENVHNCPFAEYFRFSTQTFSSSEICELAGTKKTETGNLKNPNASRADIEKLWNIFQRYGDTWCGKDGIGQFFEKNKKRYITQIPCGAQDKSDHTDVCTEEYLPNIYEKAEPLYNAVLNQTIPPVSEFTAERAASLVKVKFKCTPDFKSKLFMFFRPSYLCQIINPLYINSEAGFIKFAEKMIFSVTADISKYSPETHDILRLLESGGFINNLRINGREVKFNFRDEDIHILFEKKGNIFEHYLYLNILDKCGFPSVEAGFEFVWGGGSENEDGKPGDIEKTKNEIDLIAALPGMKTLFLSAKAIGKEESDKIKEALYEIKALADTLGFNATPAIAFGNIDLTPAVRKRSENLGVLWIDKQKLKNKNVSEIILEEIR